MASDTGDKVFLPQVNDDSRKSATGTATRGQFVQKLTSQTTPTDNHSNRDHGHSWKVAVSDVQRHEPRGRKRVISKGLAKPVNSHGRRDSKQGMGKSSRSMSVSGGETMFHCDGIQQSVSSGMNKGHGMTGGIKGAAVVLPNLQQGSREDPDSERNKMFLPHLLMSPHMRRRQLQRQQEQVVQLEVAGHDMPVPPKRQSVCESPTTPQLPRTPDPESTGLLRAQEKYGQQSSHDIHAKTGRQTRQEQSGSCSSYFSEEDEDDDVDEEVPKIDRPLRTVLQCHSFGIPMEITPPGPQQGRSARPLFHCPQCRDDWISTGVLPEKCSQPLEPTRGQEIFLSKQATVFIKKIWLSHVDTEKKHGRDVPDEVDDDSVLEPRDVNDQDRRDSSQGRSRQREFSDRDQTRGELRQREFGQRSPDHREDDFAMADDRRRYQMVDDSDHRVYPVSAGQRRRGDRGYEDERGIIRRTTSFYSDEGMDDVDYEDVQPGSGKRVRTSGLHRRTNMDTSDNNYPNESRHGHREISQQRRTSEATNENDIFTEEKNSGYGHSRNKRENEYVTDHRQVKQGDRNAVPLHSDFAGTRRNNSNSGFHDTQNDRHMVKIAYDKEGRVEQRHGNITTSGERVNMDFTDENEYQRQSSKSKERNRQKRIRDAKDTTMYAEDDQDDRNTFVFPGRPSHLQSEQAESYDNELDTLLHGYEESLVDEGEHRQTTGKKRTASKRTTKSSKKAARASRRQSSDPLTRRSFLATPGPPPSPNNSHSSSRESLKTPSNETQAMRTSQRRTQDGNYTDKDRVDVSNQESRSRRKAGRPDAKGGHLQAGVQRPPPNAVGESSTRAATLKMADANATEHEASVKWPTRRTTGGAGPSVRRTSVAPQQRLPAGNVAPVATTNRVDSSESVTGDDARLAVNTKVKKTKTAALPQNQPNIQLPEPMDKPAPSMIKNRQGVTGKKRVVAAPGASSGPGGVDIEDVTKEKVAHNSRQVENLASLGAGGAALQTKTSKRSSIMMHYQQASSSQAPMGVPSSLDTGCISDQDQCQMFPGGLAGPGFPESLTRDRRKSQAKKPSAKVKPSLQQVAVPVPGQDCTFTADDLPLSGLPGEPGEGDEDVEGDEGDGGDDESSFESESSEVSSSLSSCTTDATTATEMSTLIVPDFGGISVLSFTSAFGFSMFNLPEQYDKKSVMLRDSQLQQSVLESSKVDKQKYRQRYGKSRPDKFKNSVADLSQQVRSKLADPKPIARYVKRPTRKPRPVMGVVLEETTTSEGDVDARHHGPKEILVRGSNETARLSKSQVMEAAHVSSRRMGQAERASIADRPSVMSPNTNLSRLLSSTHLVPDVSDSGTTLYREEEEFFQQSPRQARFSPYQDSYAGSLYSPTMEGVDYDGPVQQRVPRSKRGDKQRSPSMKRAIPSQVFTGLNEAHSVILRVQDYISPESQW